jgi:threonine dehydrogenase-like Zn-dependent dehydrogenase
VRALWLEAQVLRLREDLDPPAPPPGEALVRVIVAGICNTDLELARGYYPYSGVPGHEFVGRVEQAAGAPEWVGRRVVGEISAACGGCPTCLAGMRSHCERRSVLGIVKRDGAFAQYLALPTANLHAVPDALGDELAVFTEPLAAALQVQEQVRVTPDDRVLVIGAGKLGHLVAQTLAATRCRLQVLGRSPRPLALLAARNIATTTAEALVKHRADVVVECTGRPEGLELARQAVRPRGTIVLKSTYHGPATVDLSRFVVDEITLVGSRCGPFAPALELLASGRVDPSPLVETRYPLEESLAAFEHAAKPGALKVLVDCRS